MFKFVAKNILKTPMKGPLDMKNTPDPTCDVLVIRNDVHEVTALSAFLKAAFERMQLNPSVARQFRLAVEESVVNVIDYAYPIGTEGQIEVRMRACDGAVVATIIDSGTPFDPTAQASADVSLAADDRQIGGLGIHLMREIVDDIRYQRIDGQNVLTLMKMLN